jgi:glycosyltransferase involved in cell wall biosynthesis
MTEVLLDVTRILHRTLQRRLPTGVDRVSLEYIRHFRHQARALVRYRGRWLTPDQSDSNRLFGAVLQPGPESARTIRWCVGKSFALPRVWPRVARVLFNTDHSGLEDPTYAQRVRRHDLQAFFFLHDLIPITHPEYNRPGQDEHHRRRVATMLSVGSGLIYNSAATRSAFEVYVAKAGDRAPPGVVAPLAPGRLPAPSIRRPLDAPYFVVLGTIESRKNHLLLLHLWRQLAHELGERSPRLVVIGQPGWECEQVMDLLDRCPGLRGVVEQRPSCDDAELATWLGHAQALLYPSFVEGYGIPIIEALMLNLPVIVSDLPACREAGGVIPEYLDPLDGLGWMRTVLDYAGTDSPRRRLQLELMRDYRPPTWEQHFELVNSLMERVIDAA